MHHNYQSPNQIYNIFLHFYPYLSLSYFYVNRQLKVGDAFVGYQDDTTAAVVFQAYHNLKESQPGDKRAKDKPPKEEVHMIHTYYVVIFKSV